MTTRDDIYSKDKAEFREVFRNRYVTSLSPGVIWGTILQTVIGLFGLASCVWFVLLLVYVITGLNLLNFKSVDEPQSAVDIIWGLFFSLCGGIGGALYLGHVKRRLFSRLYVLSGRPLASVVGPPYIYGMDSDDSLGLEVGRRDFDLENDCRLTKVDLGKLERAGGEMRVWYVPSTGVLVHAEWRPS